MKYFLKHKFQNSKINISNKEELERVWNNLKISQKQSILQNDLLDYLKEKPFLEISLEFRDLRSNNNRNSINGYYKHDEHLVVINNNLLYGEKSYYEAYSVLMHELKHAEQNYKIDNPFLYPNNEEIFLLNVYINGTNCLVNFCNTDEEYVNFHIVGGYIQSNICDLLYYLNISEREAFSEQEKYFNNGFLDEMYEVFNVSYNTNLQKSEINNLVDKCFMNLYTKTNPDGTYGERNLQATVMYDIVYFARYFHNNNLPFSGERVIINRSLKQEILAKYGYTIYGEEPLNNLLHNLSEFLSNEKIFIMLSKEEQLTNPKLILLLLMNERISADNILDIEAFLYQVNQIYDEIPDDVLNCLEKNFNYSKNYMEEIENEI